MKKISVLVPMYNEQEVLPALFSRLSAVMDSMPQFDWEALFVNDGSRDNTLAVALSINARDPRFHVLDLSRNYGKETAMMAGFDFVTGDCCVIMDADLQHPPEVIPAMVEEWEAGYDDVYGHRLTRGKESWLKRRLSLAYYKMLQSSTKVPVMENVGDFRLLDRVCVNALRQMREYHRYTKGMYCYVGFRKKAVPFEQAGREAGETKWSLRQLFMLAVEGITSYTTAPLRIATWVGVVVSFGALLYMLFIIVKTLVYGESVQGFPTIMVTILFLGGMQLLALGVLGEYIGRIFNESKQRPPYFAATLDGRKLDNRTLR